MPKRKKATNFIPWLLAWLLLAAMAAAAQHMPAPVGFTTPASEAVARLDTPGRDLSPSYDVMFMAEPGDTLSFTNPDDTLAFEPDTIKNITEADVRDTFDFRTFVPGTDYQLIEDRISCLSGGGVPMTYNKTVNSFINFFTVRKRNYTQTMLERKDAYFPLFEEALKRHGLPDELKYLSIVESGLSTRAISRSGAVGLWQFMGPTGRDFALKQDKYLDTRMDPVQATEAACKYLKMLYGIFHDWELALAAYNCGPGAISRVMRRTGGRTFWEIYRHIPQETRSYVPQFTAVIYAMNFAKEHNIYPDLDSMLVLPETDTIVLDRQINMALLAEHLAVDPTTLSLLNPALRRAITPETPGFAITLPKETAARFRAERQCFLDGCVGAPIEEEPLTPKYYLTHTDEPVRGRKGRKGRRGRREVTEEEIVEAESAMKGGDNDIPFGPPQRKTHKVRRGETLFAIADHYGVTVGEMKKQNHLHSTRLKMGQRLVVMVAPKVAKPHKASKSKKQEAGPEAKKVVEEIAATKPAETAKPVDVETEGPDGHKVHQVQAGDTLWNICQRYQGLTVKDLMRLNNLKTKNLKVGQKLILG